MKIVPVLDLLNGEAVHAKRGERTAYQPLRSKLCDSSRPLDVVDGLLNLAPFDTVYLADLNAIQGTGDNADTVHEIQQQHPALGLWVDAGIANATDVAEFLQSTRARPVLGSETLEDAELPSQAMAKDSGYAPILSLDFKDSRFLGPEGLDRQPQRWPKDVIIMNLDSVGTGDGPPLDLLRHFRDSAPDTYLYAAGGVRDSGDLERLTEIGLEGVLVGSALHMCWIGMSDLTGHV